MKKTIDSSKIKILICCHKQCELPEDDIFLPIQVGAAISVVDLGMQRDDQVNGMPCDNISAKNKSFCELTALYWAWKNIKRLYPDLEYIGINHYRRYFNFEKRFTLRDSFIYPENVCKNYELNLKTISKELTNGKTIIAKKRVYPYSLNTDYCCCHYSDDIKTLKKTISELYPKYIYAFDNVLGQNNTLAHYNMTIIRWDYFSEYCEWLFNILFESEKQIDITNYNDAQKRIFGYMSERLFNVWLFYKNIKTIEYPINWYADKPEESLFKYLATKHRNNATFMKFLPFRIKIKKIIYNSHIFRKLYSKHKQNIAQLNCNVKN